MELRLLPEQEHLLYELVERERQVPRDQRTEFYFIQGMSHVLGRIHGPGPLTKATHSELVTLSNAGLISVISWREHRIERFALSHFAYTYYEHMKTERRQPLEQVESDIVGYLDFGEFPKRYQEAYQSWSEASRLLRSSSAKHHLIEIGHHCREAFREYSLALASRFCPPGISTVQNPTSRLRLIIVHLRDQIGTPHEFLDALVEYFSQVWKLANRQEHSADKVGDSLTWEDARRLVFQTAIVMVEVDRLLWFIPADNRYFVVRYDGPAQKFHAHRGAPLTLPGQTVELSEHQIRNLQKQGHRFGELPPDLRR